MGFGLDEHYDEALDDDTFDADLMEERIARRIWTQRDGTTIRVSRMDKRHLNNTIRHILRGGNCFGYADQWLPILQAELAARGR